MTLGSSGGDAVYLRELDAWLLFAAAMTLLEMALPGPLSRRCSRC